ncbi:hypothetical protein GCM10023332_01110 [Luteimonas vadosa]|uniref:Uncharacterized protein n=1 Tax=Luteimonas vadosa TaxID=1165507 RepID=A0ABP9DQ29_9GAMM
MRGPKRAVLRVLLRTRNLGPHRERKQRGAQADPERPLRPHPGEGERVCVLLKSPTEMEVA